MTSDNLTVLPSDATQAHCRGIADEQRNRRQQEYRIRYTFWLFQAAVFSFVGAAFAVLLGRLF